MQTISSISFQGKLKRQTRTVFDPTSPTKRRVIEASKEDLVASYDSQIGKIEAYKQFAIKLDDMMFNDADIQEKINNLADDAEVEVAANFRIDSAEDAHIDIDSPALIATNEDGEFEPMDIEYSKEGPNKEEILAWLDEIEEIFD